MATWGVHIRIAEKFLEAHSSIDIASFLVGSIGPDCGQPIKDSNKFSPDTSISHWYDELNNINPDNFYNEYLTMKIDDHKKHSFLLGYYIHLLTDIKWRDLVHGLMESHKGYAPLKTDKKFIWTIKKDWYDLDHLYFKNHQNSMFYTIFQHIKEFPDYLDYYPQNAISTKVKQISKFYLSEHENIEREYIYLTMDDMNDFIKNTMIFIDGEVKI